MNGRKTTPRRMGSLQRVENVLNFSSGGQDLRKNKKKSIVNGRSAGSVSRLQSSLVFFGGVLLTLQVNGVHKGG